MAAPQHEVIAVALNVTSSSTNLFMASNHGVPPNTIRYISGLWELLQDLSHDYEQHNKLPNHSNSPPQPQTSSLPLAAQKRVMQFRRDALKFCSNKLNRRINKHYSSFLAIDSPELSLFQEVIEGLAELMRERDTLLDKDWDLVWDGLSNLQVETTKVLRDNPDLFELTTKTFPAKRYLEKMFGFVTDIKILLNAANFPRLRNHFKIPFVIKTLEPIDSTTALPSSIKGWEEVASKALKEVNSAKTEELEYEVLPSKVRSDAQKLVQTRTTTPRNFVHCECIILSHMLFHREELFINYIGVSKLCCRGCSFVITSVNFVHGMRIYTKGCHHKWYYPWKFPPIPEAIKSKVVKHTYEKIANFFGNNYSGFRPKTQATLSDSDSNSLADDRHSDFEGSGANGLRKFKQNLHLRRSKTRSG